MLPVAAAQRLIASTSVYGRVGSQYGPAVAITARAARRSRGSAVTGVLRLLDAKDAREALADEHDHAGFMPRLLLIDVSEEEVVVPIADQIGEELDRGLHRRHRLGGDRRDRVRAQRCEHVTAHARNATLRNRVLEVEAPATGGRDLVAGGERERFVLGGLGVHRHASV